MDIQPVLIGVFAAVNAISFFIVAADKRRAVRKETARRTPEGLLFFLAASLGGVGVYAGMLAFRHKTKRWYFQIGIPLLVLQNLATLFVLRDLLVR